MSSQNSLSSDDDNMEQDFDTVTTQQDSCDSNSVIVKVHMDSDSFDVWRLAEVLDCAHKALDTSLGVTSLKKGYVESSLHPCKQHATCLAKDCEEL